MGNGSQSNRSRKGSASPLPTGVGSILEELSVRASGHGAGELWEFSATSNKSNAFITSDFWEKAVRLGGAWVAGTPSAPPVPVRLRFMMHHSRVGPTG
jgi:hypothetical protein